MNKNLFRSLLLLITFTVALILAVIRWDAICNYAGLVATIFSPLILGFALAFVLNGPCSFFEKHLNKALGKTKCSKLALPLAVTLSYVLLFAVISSLISFVIPQVVENLELFMANWSGYVAQTQSLINSLVTRFHMDAVDFSHFSSLIEQMANALLTTFTTAVPQILSLTGTIVSLFVTSLLAFVFSIYMLAGKASLLSQMRRVLKAYLPKECFRMTMDVMELTSQIFSKFIVGQIVEACILGTLISLGCVIFGFEYALLIGTLVGVTALVPIVGAYVGAITSALLLAMVSPMQAVWFLVMLTCVQQIEGNVIYPRLVGASIGLPGIWVLGAITIGGGLFGFTGMLLSVPVLAVIYTIIRNDVHKRLTNV